MLEQLFQSDPIAEQLIQNQRQIDSLQLEQSKLAFQLARGKVWDEEGFNCAVDWLRFNCHVTSNVGSDYITVGEHEARLTESIQAMDNQEIGYAHLKVLARTADAVRIASMKRSCCSWPRRTHRASSTTSACSTGTRSMPRPTTESKRTCTKAVAFV